MASVVFELLEPVVADVIEGGAANATEAALAEGAQGAWADALDIEEREVFSSIFEQPQQQQAAEEIVAGGENAILGNAGIDEVAAQAPVEDLVPVADREAEQKLSWRKLEEMQANLVRIGKDKTMPPGWTMVSMTFFTLATVMIDMASEDSKKRNATSEFNDTENEMTDLENALSNGDVDAVKSKAIALKAKIDAIIDTVIQKGLDGTGLTKQQYQALVKMRTILIAFITDT